MRDLKADLKLFERDDPEFGLIAVEFYVEAINRAIAAEAEVEKLKQQVSDMRCCMNCKHCSENGACDEEIECGVSYKNWEWEG